MLKKLAKVRRPVLLPNAPKNCFVLGPANRKAENIARSMKRTMRIGVEPILSLTSLQTDKRIARIVKEKVASTNNFGKFTAASELPGVTTSMVSTSSNNRNF